MKFSNLIATVTLILILQNTSASYIYQNELIILRSQYVEDVDITVDGSLTEALWGNAGNLYVQADSFDQTSQNSLIIVSYANNNNELFMSFAIDHLVYEKMNFTLVFDAESDGILSTPEDGLLWQKDATHAATTQDIYWDGTEWVADRSSIQSISSGNQISDGTLIIECTIDLISNDVVYDGIQIPSTTNSYLGFAFSLEITYFDNSTLYYNFPTSPTNATGFIDLKLAGPEDKDLPTYTPPPLITTTTSDTHVTNAARSDDSAANFSSLHIIIISLFIFPVINRIRRRKL